MDSIDGPLEFICNGRSGAVHVIAASSRGGGCDPDRAWPESSTREFADLGPIWGLATMPALALCGWVGKTAPGFDDEFTDCFPDEKLCHRCRHLLGEQAHLAFEHRQPGDQPGDIDVDDTP